MAQHRAQDRGLYLEMPGLETDNIDKSISLTDLGAAQLCVITFPVESLQSVIVPGPYTLIEMYRS